MRTEPIPVPSRRGVLRAFIASVCVSALAGAVVLVAGDFSEIGVKVLVSSLSVSGASLLALAAAAHFEARGERLPAVPTCLAALAALFLTNVGLWGEVGGEAFWKTAFTAWIAGAVGAHVALLGLARLAEKHLPVAGATDLALYLLGALGTVMLWGEVDSEAALRALGLLSIAAAAGTLTIPVLHRMNGDEGARRLRSASHAPAPMLCPACGARTDAPLGLVECPACGAVFRVDVVHAAPGR